MKKFNNEKRADALAAALPDLIRDKGWEKQLDLYSLFVEWERIVGAETACHARPSKIVRNVIWVEVDNSSWMHQLQFEKVRILEGLNAALELSRLQDVKFTLAGKVEETEPEKAKVTFVPVDAAELAAFEYQVSLIEDKESREALIRLWYLSKACRRG
ncbi:MAG: DUF721 domain-containing protein [Desulfocapsaceae bacterium]|nr:DUF721 domain-containing protein [Desulfosporosinus sp.]MDR3629565.1 DUF721 domain-containing protein [Desulfocapsaceae bacterium]